VRVILGSYGNAKSPIRAPSGINYLHVRLKDGERWEYQPPAGHDVAWTYSVTRKELAVFEEGETALSFEGPAEFVLGSAVKHPHELALGYYSVTPTRKRSPPAKPRSGRIGERLNLPMGVLA